MSRFASCARNVVTAAPTTPVGRLPLLATLPPSAAPALTNGEAAVGRKSCSDALTRSGLLLPLMLLFHPFTTAPATKCPNQNCAALGDTQFAAMFTVPRPIDIACTLPGIPAVLG